MSFDSLYNEVYSMPPNVRSPLKSWVLIPYTARCTRYHHSSCVFDSHCGTVICSLSMAFSVYSIIPQKIKLTAISAVMLNTYSTNLWLITPYWKCNSDRCVMKTNIFGMTFLYFKTTNNFLSNYFYKILIYTITTCWGWRTLVN